METKAAGSLTHGRLGKQILAFSLPLMLSNVLQVLFNMSDIAVVGRFSGPIALGAVGSTATLVTLFTGFLIGLGSGINALVARFLGAGSREETQRTVHTALALSLIFGAVLLLLGELTAVPLLKLLGTKEELIDGATIYLRIYFLGMPAMALYNFGNAVLSAAGDTRRPLLYLLIAGILNVALNLFFVIVCGMSADGVALASILTQYLSSVLILIALVRTKDAYGVRPKCIRLHRDKLAPLLTLCCSAGLQNAIFAVANLFIQAGVNSFDSLMVKGNSAAANADAMIYDCMAAFYMACASFMSQNYGAGKPDRVKKSYFISLAYSFGVGLILGGSLFLFGRTFLSLFTTEAAVVSTATATVEFEKYYNGSELYAIDDVTYKNYNNKAYLPAKVLHSADAVKWYTLYTGTDVGDTELYTDDLLIQYLVTQGTPDGEERRYGLTWNAKAYILAVAQDAEGHYGPVFRKSITPSLSGVSPISDLGFVTADAGTQSTPVMLRAVTPAAPLKRTAHVVR